jgi:hypothetical protein
MELKSKPNKKMIEKFIGEAPVTIREEQKTDVYPWEIPFLKNNPKVGTYVSVKISETMHQKILFVADKINKKKADVIRDALQIMVESTLEEILPDYRENK